MKILIIGGTGKTGRELIDQGLDHGHIITAIVRNPKKINNNNPNLIILQGNVLQPESFEQAFQGQDVVLSALGHKRYFIKTSILSVGTKNIIAAMEKNNIKRFICITSLGINDSKFKLGLCYTLFVIPVIIYFYFLDKSKQEKLIMKSKLDWIIVQPAQLTNGRKRGHYKHGSKIGNYILTKMISRADVAHFMLNLLKNKNYMHQCVGISY